MWGRPGGAGLAQGAGGVIDVLLGLVSTTGLEEGVGLRSALAAGGPRARGVESPGLPCARTADLLELSAHTGTEASGVGGGLLLKQAPVSVQAGGGFMSKPPSPFNPLDA